MKLIILLFYLLLCTCTPTRNKTIDNSLQAYIKEENDELKKQWENDKNTFYFYETERGELVNDSADLILEIEIVQIDKCVNDNSSHLDFCVTGKVTKNVKGEYNRQPIGLLLKRVKPLEPYDPEIYHFKIGEVTVIKARKSGNNYIFIDKRVPHI